MYYNNQEEKTQLNPRLMFQLNVHLRAKQIDRIWFTYNFK